ncbi:hypothetical protein TRIUR3_33607 [Triticum urartu]|uniref:Uncharacterized protein n=1 Tax=Triticum urartu TaxID=4572 RepID=M8AVJ3_TRIUA|nr:hypothetical protein TRIUR3_33607 [Triticum urartu]
MAALAGSCATELRALCRPMEPRVREEREVRQDCGERGFVGWHELGAAEHGQGRCDAGLSGRMGGGGSKSGNDRCNSSSAAHGRGGGAEGCAVVSAKAVTREARQQLRQQAAAGMARCVGKWRQK